MNVAPDTTTAEFARERMIGVYTRMPRNPAMTEMFSRYFKALDEREGGSLVHCFAGKDRTGVAAMLVLHVLGVHRDPAPAVREHLEEGLVVLDQQAAGGGAHEHLDPAAAGLLFCSR